VPTSPGSKLNPTFGGVGNALKQEWLGISFMSALSAPPAHKKPAKSKRI
jgi:hypothetical protein